MPLDCARSVSDRRVPGPTSVACGPLNERNPDTEDEKANDAND